MKTIYRKYDKTEIPNLPRVTFTGEIRVVDTLEDVEAAVDYLLSQDILGVDTETRPSFRKGVKFEVSLLQVSSLDVCYLFRLNKIGVPPAVLRLLTDKKVPKIGLSWHDDLRHLHERAQFEPGYFIDIQEIAKAFGIADMSLQKLYANLFHQKISKAQRLSNWEHGELRESQKVYAATDAWACIMLYHEFANLKASEDYEIVEPIVHEPEAVQVDESAETAPAANEEAN